MGVPVPELLALGRRRVTLTTVAGSFAGTILSEHLTERSIMLEFTLEGDSGYPIVIPLDDIIRVTER